MQESLLWVFNSSINRWSACRLLPCFCWALHECGADLQDNRSKLMGHLHVSNHPHWSRQPAFWVIRKSTDCLLSVCLNTLLKEIVSYHMKRKKFSAVNNEYLIHSDLLFGHLWLVPEDKEPPAFLRLHAAHANSILYRVKPRRDGSRLALLDVEGMLGTSVQDLFVFCVCLEQRLRNKWWATNRLLWMSASLDGST